MAEIDDTVKAVVWTPIGCTTDEHLVLIVCRTKARRSRVQHRIHQGGWRFCRWPGTAEGIERVVHDEDVVVFAIGACKENAAVFEQKDPLDTVLALDADNAAPDDEVVEGS